MRTTLDIDDAVLAAAKEIARERGQTTGMVISELARKGMEGHRHLRHPRPCRGADHRACRGHRPR